MSSTDVDLEAYRQTEETLRHYSGLRFIVLGAFTAVTGAVFAFTYDKLPQQPTALRAVSVFFIIASLAFAGIEYRINEILEFQRQKIVDLSKYLGMSNEASQLPPKSFLLIWVTPVATLMIYGGSIVMWLFALRR